MVIIHFPHSFYICCLKFYYKKKLPHVRFIYYSIIYTRCMDIYFILRIIIPYYYVFDSD